MNPALLSGFMGHVPMLVAGGGLVAQIADGGVAGGNARGANAVDLQTVRSAAAFVASGQFSVIGGGRENQASGQSSCVPGGQYNVASGSNAFAIGGGCVASGASSWAIGETAWDRGHIGRGAFAAGRFVATGDAQCGEFSLRRIGTDATTIRLTADNAAPGTANTVNLPNNSTYAALILIEGRQIAGSAGTVGDSAWWWLAVGMKRGANAAAMAVQSVHTLHSFRDTGAAAWNVAVVADTTNGGPAIQAVGELNKTIQWVARVLTAETVG